MAVYPLDMKNFENLTNTKEIAFIDFWADWCAPCKQFASIYKKVAQKYPHIRFTQVDIEKEPELAEMFHVRSIPHLIVMKEGIVIYSDSGTIPESTLIELVQQAEKADLTEVKEEIAKEEQSKEK